MEMITAKCTIESLTPITPNFFHKAQVEAGFFRDPQVEKRGEYFRAIFFHREYFDGIIVVKDQGCYRLLRAPMR